jgi:hypothetical protein
MRATTLVSMLGALLFAAACSASAGNTFTGSGGAGATTTDTGTGGELSLGGGFIGTGGSVPGDGCSEEAKLVYLLTTDNKIRSFDPGKKEFGQPFSVACPVPNDGNDWQPNSMAVDRNTVAWVNYVGSDFLGGDAAGLIYEVDLAKKTCAQAPTVHLPSGWFRVGMGFSTDALGSTTETLWVTGTSSIGQSPGLGRIDPGSKILNQNPGPWSGDALLAGQDAELTGTGDAKLFGFFTTSPVRVAEIDKTNAKILSNHTVGSVPKPSAWAFSFWGGAFYFYTSDGFQSSTITRYDASTNQVDGAYVLTAPAIVVGAGVSTCAPLKPPS